MNEFEIIKLMNETTKVYLNKKNEPSEKNEKIQRLLENDEAFFFKIEKEKALNVLKIIGIGKENMEEEYAKLTSQKEFCRLRDKGMKIDDSFIVKYDLNYNNDIFKDKKENNKTEETALVEVKEKWYEKLISVMKRIFKIKNVEKWNEIAPEMTGAIWKLSIWLRKQMLFG